ncbi:MAG: hypothetical protein JWN72_1502, partial [Thermoleophilia bacterium]|nr:hypothetical protein [Thermoleophilia bacterium]
MMQPELDRQVQDAYDCAAQHVAHHGEFRERLLAEHAER